MKKAIRFTAEWCGPCKAYAPTFNKVAEEVKDWSFETIDVDKDLNSAQKYSIRSIPTTVFEVNGEVQEKYTGVLTSVNLVKKLELWNPTPSNT